MGIDFNFESALAKTLIAAGLMLTPGGSMLLSVADRDKPEAVPIIKKLASLDYKLFATEGTAAMIGSLGIPVTMTTKKLGEGHPNVVDVINNSTVDAVINTVTGSGNVLRDGLAIRRAAVERRVPCFTSLDTVRVAVEVLASDSQNYNILPLHQYRAGKPA